MVIKVMGISPKYKEFILYEGKDIFSAITLLRVAQSTHDDRLMRIELRIDGKITIRWMHGLGLSVTTGMMYEFVSLILKPISNEAYQIEHNTMLTIASLITKQLDGELNMVNDGRHNEFNTAPFTVHTFVTQTDES